MAERPRKFWGWGYEDEVLDSALVTRVESMLQIALGIEHFTPASPPRLDEISLRPARIPLSPELAALHRRRAA
jgi:hypothetical protein